MVRSADDTDVVDVSALADVARSKGMTMEEFFEMVAERGMEMAMQGMGI